MTLAERARPVPWSLLAVIAAAWCAAAIGQATGELAALHGSAHAVEHDYPLWLVVLLPPFWVAAFVFMVAWQVMIGAMMLPSSLPMMRLYHAVSGSQPRPFRARLAFLGGYAVVWTAFGAVCFAADVAVHRSLSGNTWLAAHPRLVPAAVLAGAGLFQFSSLKDRCLEECRHPAPFLLRQYRRGARGGYALGRAHGMFCLGCCWALMLLMVAAGLVSLFWMAALAAVMFYEKAGRHGASVTPYIGVGLLVAAGVIVAGAL